MTTLEYTKEKREILGLSQSKLAELTGIKQYYLSQHELGTRELKETDLKNIINILSSQDLVEEIVKRKKRYTKHSYASQPRNNSKRAKYKLSERNSQYLDFMSQVDEPHELNAISCFSGIGGFSLGFKKAGFNILGHIEIEEKVRKIYQLNFPKSLCLGTDITKINEGILNKHLGLNKTVDVMIGGPPCQGFSLSGKRNVNDPRNTLFEDYCRLISVITPKVAVLENVKKLTSMRNNSGGLIIDDIKAKFGSLNYKIEEFLIDASDYGVPQKRERVIFIAVRDDIGIEPFFPFKSFNASPDLLSNYREKYVFADAVSDLPYLESGEFSDDKYHSAVAHPEHVINWLWNVPEGKSAHDNKDKSLRPPSGYNTTYKRQVWDHPASTVQTTFGMISGCRNVHPIATRSLTIREAARIQSFPDEFKFTGTKGAIRTGIGNAVPPILAREIARSIKTSLA